MLDEILPTRTVAAWLEACDAHSIPAAPVVDLEHIADDPHFAAVKLLEVREHSTEGRYRQIKDPVTFASAPDRQFLDAPQLGQHTIEVLREMGYKDEDIADATGIAT